MSAFDACELLLKKNFGVLLNTCLNIIRCLSIEETIVAVSGVEIKLSWMLHDNFSLKLMIKI